MERHFIIKNRLGLHARAAARLVQITNNYRSNLTFQFNGQEVDGKGILNILTLACPMGSEITARAEGPDEGHLLDEVERLIGEKFGEE